MAGSTGSRPGGSSVPRWPLFAALATHVGARRAAWLVAGGLAVIVVSAWFNRGFQSYDEHFQIIELAWYKLGRAPAETLAWEFREQMRPGVQPLIVAWSAQGLEAIGLTSPFLLAFLLRLASGLLAVWVSLALALHVLPEVRSDRLKVALVSGSLLLWFLPFSHVRFSADNWGGLLLFAGVCFLLDAVGEGRQAVAGARRRRQLGPVTAAAAAGLLLGFAFYCRYQLGFSIAGIGCWLVFVRRPGLRTLAALTAGFLAAAAACVLADRWLYDTWVFTPYEYARANLLEGKAAQFGVEPWWYYLAEMLMFLVPPFSLVLVGLLGAAAWFQRRHVLVWAALPFLVGHSLIGHKEDRFLVPMTWAVVPLLILAADRIASEGPGFLKRWMSSRAGRAGARAFVVVNLAILAVMAVKPSHETEVVFRWLWRAAEKEPITVYTTSESPYTFLNLEICFYRPRDLTVSRFETPDGLRRAAAAAPGRVFLFHRGFSPPDAIAASGLEITPVVRTLPEWVMRVNVNNWVSRMRVWTVFSIRAHAP